jgi:uncharacterized protein (TIGR03118 family)
MFLTKRRRPATQLPARPRLEALEDRCVLSGNVLQTNLVSDLPGVANVTDPNLVNAWGIAESGTSPFWIADNNAGASTLYNTQGQPVNAIGTTVKQNFVTIPTPGDPTGQTGTPTGTVFNTATASGAFQVTNGTKSAPAIFLFDTEDGTIVGWNPGINPVGSDPTKAGTFGTIALDNSGNNFTEPDPAKQTGAVYKGLTIATDSSGQTLLYAANFRSGKVEVYTPNFKPDTALSATAFTDPSLPAGYAPFGIQELNGQIYVTYAKQNADKHDNVPGEGKGFVDVYNLDGSPGLAHNQVRLISRGELNSPWGLAIAPSSFGSLAGDLLVGNFGDGFIHVYSATTPGQFMGTLKDPDGEPIQIDGLWALRVGNGGNGGDKNTIYFTAGLDHEQHGLFGSLTAVAAGTPEGPAEAQKVQAAVDVFQLDLTAVVNDIKTNAPAAQLRQDEQALDQAFVDLVRAERAFARDSRADMGTSGSTHHRDGDDAKDALSGAIGHKSDDLD